MGTGPKSTPDQLQNRLESWKEIAAYLRRDVRTVQRWEKRQGLPVHRHNHERLGTVYAFRAELDEWWIRRKPRLEPPAAGGRRWWPIGVGTALAVGVTALGFYYAGSVKRAWSGGSASTVARKLWTDARNLLSSNVPPDGKYVAYLDWQADGNIFLRELATGQARQLTHHPPPKNDPPQQVAFSRDGAELAYPWSTSDWTWELRVAAVEGSHDRAVFRDPAVKYLGALDWSPDGRTILVMVSPQQGAPFMALVPARGGPLKTLREFREWPWKAAFSPDGRYVAYDEQGEGDPWDYDVRLIATETGAEVARVKHPARDHFLAWTPDGAKILFGSDRTGSAGLWLLPVFEGHPAGKAELARPDAGLIASLGFDRKGAFYYALHTGMLAVRAARVDVEAAKILGPPETLTTRFVGETDRADWSPDGQSLVYRSRPLGLSDLRTQEALVIRSVRTGSERRLTVPFRLILDTRWEDSRRILVTGWDLQGRQGLYLVDVNSGAVTVLIRQPGVHIRQAAWTPDGRSVIYNTNDPAIRGCRFVRREFETGRETTLHRIPRIARMSLSPDGRMLAFADGKQVSVISAAGGGPPRLVASLPHRLMEVEWSPDGRYLLVAKVREESGADGATELWRVDLGDGSARELGLRMGLVPHLRMNPDQSIVFSDGRREMEVWAMEGFLH